MQFTFFQGLFIDFQNRYVQNGMERKRKEKDVYTFYLDSFKKGCFSSSCST